MNPFTPVFGRIPQYLAGREYLINEIITALSSGPNDPNRTSILVGPRGSGKTATLGYLSNEAESNGWIAVNVTAIDGMLDDILQVAERKSKHLIETSQRSHLSEIKIKLAALEASFDIKNGNSESATWRTKITHLLELFKEIGVGLLITVDEVIPQSKDLVKLVTTYQHLLNENYQVALLLAGLPHQVSLLLNGKSVSFLRRAARKELGSIADYELNAAYRITADIGGKAFDDKALTMAVDAACGFPFMFQLVGYRAWAETANRNIITSKDVKNGIQVAAADMKQRVLKSSLDELSNKDIQFLRAMLTDAKSSKTSIIAKRLKSSVPVAGTYRRRLLDQGLILECGRGSFEFAMPLLREYLPEYINDYCDFE